MARTARLQYGRSADLDPCIICAKMAWLSERLRVFSAHITKAERALYATWSRSHPILLGASEDSKARQQRWARAMPGVAQRLGGDPRAVEKIKAKTALLNRDVNDYTAIVRRESQHYIAANIPFPIHARWRDRLSGVLTGWGMEHPICLGVDEQSQCGLRMGGYHWASSNDEGLCQLCAVEKSRGGPVQVRGRGWVGEPATADTERIIEEDDNGN